MSHTPKTLYGNSREMLEAAERKNELLAQIAGETYTNEDNPSTLYNTDKAMLAAAKKENELLEKIAEGGGSVASAVNGMELNYATGVLSLTHDDEPIEDGSVTLPAYGLNYDSGTGGLTLTENGSPVQGQTVALPAYGSPLTASSGEDMTDETKVYVYTGETTADFTNGDWYYYDATDDEWKDGGTYNSTAFDTDTTLAVSGAAADAKVTGDKVAELKEAINSRLIALPYVPGITKGQRYASGAANSNSRYCRSTNLYNGFASIFAVSMEAGTYEYAVMYYDSTGATDGTGFISSTVAYVQGMTYIPAFAQKIAISFHRLDNASMQDSDKSAIQAAFKWYINTDTSLEKKGYPADALETGRRIGDVESDVAKLDDQMNDVEDILHPTISNVKFNEYTSDAAYHSIGFTMIAGHKYRIVLTLSGYSETDLGRITSITTYSSAESSANVDALLSEFQPLKADEAMVVDYTPTANCSRIKIGYNSNYSSEDNKSIWQFIDMEANKVENTYESVNVSLIFAEEVKWSQHTRWEWTIGSGDNFKWSTGNASTSNSYVIPVKDAETIEIYANDTQSTYYTLLTSANPTNNSAPDQSGISGFSGRKTLSAGWYIKLDNKYYKANYLYVANVGSSVDVYRPRKIVLSTYKSNPYDKIAEQQTQINILKQLAYGTVAIGTEGHDLPQNQGVRNFVRRIEYARTVPWTSVGTIPLNSSYGSNLSAGSQTGLPYSSVKEKMKFVGFNVSFKTFFTAAHNPYSLLYTENVSANNSASDYGFTYHGSNCAAYYGIVCSVLAMIGTGMPVYWGSREYRYLWRTEQMLYSYDQKATGLRIGDLLPETGHIAMITDIVRGNDGIPTDITLVETYHPHPVEKHYTAETMNERIRTEKETVCHYPKLYSVTALDEFDAENYEYNDDICTYAGDEAAFYEGEPVWINYTKGDYTQMLLYKGNTLVQTITLDNDSSIHKVDVSEYVTTYGDYKACLTDGVNNSGFTTFRVVQTDVSLTNANDVLTVNFASANAKPVYIELCYQDGTSKGNYVLTDDDIAKGSVTFDAVAQLMEQQEFVFADHTLSGNRFDETTYCRVFFDCGWGVVTNEPIDTGIYSA